MSIEKHKAFLDSLDGEKGLSEEWRLLTPGVDKWQAGDMYWHNDRKEWREWEPERLNLILGRDIHLHTVARRRAESRQIPDLKERVKEFGRCIIEAVIDAKENPEQFHAIIALCAPEVKP